MDYFCAEEETLDREGLEALQRRKLSDMLAEVLRSNAFYRQRLGGSGFDASRDPLGRLPFTTRAAVQSDQLAHPPYGTNLTYPRGRYVRLHQTSGSSRSATSGTTGSNDVVRLRWLDTPESWSWFRKCWRIIYRGTGVTDRDRLFFPFSFGAFIGFWAGFEAATEMGAFVLPAGGMTTAARLEHMLTNEVTVVCCTPTYALRMAEVAAASGIDLVRSSVRTLIVAGEPGGSIPSTHERIERMWAARVFDHSGMTEIGPCSFECGESPGGVHIIESEFIAEVVDPATDSPVADGELGELVLTNLGRWGSPLIRYRTGDQVRMIRRRCACGRWFARLDGGILGRTDDMLVIRGNNVFPSTVEGLIRGFSQVAEFAIEVDRRGAMAELVIQVEPTPEADTNGLARRITDRFRDRLHFKPTVTLAAPGSLPRFDMKARRVVFRTDQG